MNANIKKAQMFPLLKYDLSEDFECITIIHKIIFLIKLTFLHKTNFNLIYL